MNNASFKPATLRATPQPAAVRRSLSWLPVVVLAAAALQVGCASVPAPTEQMAASTAAVASAERAGALTLAPAEMALARDKLARANASMVEEKFERARMLAEAALVDARLAEARARNVQAAKSATEVREGNRVLRQELQRAAQ